MPPRQCPLPNIDGPIDAHRQAVLELATRATQGDEAAAVSAMVTAAETLALDVLVGGGTDNNGTSIHAPCLARLYAARQSLGLEAYVFDGTPPPGEGFGRGDGEREDDGATPSDSEDELPDGSEQITEVKRRCASFLTPTFETTPVSKFQTW